MLPEYRFRTKNWAILNRSKALNVCEQHQHMKNKLFNTTFLTAGIGPSFIGNFTEIDQETGEDERVGNAINIHLICNSIAIRCLNQDTPLPETAEVRHVIFVDHQNKNGIVSSSDIYDGLNGWYNSVNSDRFQIIYDKKFEIRPGQVIEVERVVESEFEWESNVDAGQTQTTPVNEIIALINAMPGGVGTTDGTQAGIRVGTFSARKEITTGTGTATETATVWVNEETIKTQMMGLFEKSLNGQRIWYSGPFGTDIAGVGIYESFYVNTVPMAIESKTLVYYEDL